VQLSTGYDFVKGVINVSMGQFTEPIYNDHNYSGVFFLCEETKHLLPIIQNASNNDKIIEAEITGNQLHSIQCSADRSGYMIYQSIIKMSF
jgi:hypothetical protein